MNRTGEVERKTKETNIKVFVDLNGGKNEISTDIGFFDHMLTALAVHSGISMKIFCKGDLEVDGHHTVEDVGIALGKAMAQALGDRKGIARYGSSFIPMDEALAFASVDISGRPFLHFDAEFSQQSCGDFDCCLATEFFRAFAVNAQLTLHIKKEYGQNAHHELEAIFKAVAHALKAACAIEYGETLSTKGVL